MTAIPEPGHSGRQLSGAWTEASVPKLMPRRPLGEGGWPLSADVFSVPGLDDQELTGKPMPITVPGAMIE